MADWYNDSIHKCSKCGTIFKVYTTIDTPGVDFCPICGHSTGDEEDLTEEEIEELYR